MLQISSASVGGSGAVGRGEDVGLPGELWLSNSSSSESGTSPDSFQVRIGPTSHGDVSLGSMERTGFSMDQCRFVIFVLCFLLNPSRCRMSQTTWLARLGLVKAGTLGGAGVQGCSAERRVCKA